MSTSIGDALRDEAHRKLMTNFELKDWQLSDSADPAQVVEPTRKMSIEVEEDRINIYHGDEQTLVLWVELYDGKLAVHAYDNEHDEPTNLWIESHEIRVEFPTS